VAEKKLSKKHQREQAAFRQLFEEKRHLGDRLPDLVQAPPVALQPIPLVPPTAEVPLTAPQPTLLVPPTPDSSPAAAQRKKGPRAQKATGLHIALHEVQQHGFPHPRQHGGFLMLPREFKALLALEPLSVIQVVYEVFEQTIGWEDPDGKHGRREWVKLSLRQFQLACGMTLSQVQRGLKGALNNGYLRRRPKMGEFEYAIRWRDTTEGDEVYS
jgi:hypothetical protein